MSLNFWLVFTSGRNTTVFLPMQCLAISPAIWCRYGSNAVAMSPDRKSPACIPTWDRSILRGTVRALIGDRYPCRIAFGRVYS